MLHGAGYLLHLTEQMSHQLKPQGAYKNSVTSVAFWRLSPAVEVVLGWDGPAERWECQRAAACLAVLVAVHEPFAHTAFLESYLWIATKLPPVCPCKSCEGFAAGASGWRAASQGCRLIPFPTGQCPGTGMEIPNTASVLRQKTSSPTRRGFPG